MSDQLFHENKPSKCPVPNKFEVIFKSNAKLGDLVKSAVLNLAKNTLSLELEEDENASMTKWLLDTPDNEAITFIVCDISGKSRCVLSLDGVDLCKHRVHFGKTQQYTFGVDTQQKLWHHVKLRFTSAERLSDFKA